MLSSIIENHNNLIYYAIGLLSGIFLTVISSYNSGPKKMPLSKKIRSWTKIENINYTFDVDHEFKQKMTGQEIVYVMAEVMKIKVEKEDFNLKQITVDPGKYSVSFVTNARFVKRD